MKTSMQLLSKLLAAPTFANSPVYVSLDGTLYPLTDIVFDSEDDSKAVFLCADQGEDRS